MIKLPGVLLLSPSCTQASFPPLTIPCVFVRLGMWWRPRRGRTRVTVRGSHLRITFKLSRSVASTSLTVFGQDKAVTKCFLLWKYRLSKLHCTNCKRLAMCTRDVAVNLSLFLIRGSVLCCSRILCWCLSKTNLVQY